jgi:hypothetical protein
MAIDRQERRRGAMTFQEGLAKITREIDAILVKRMDEYMLLLIASGVEPEELDEIIHEQRAREAVWRTETLAQFEATLRAAATEDW